MNVCVCVCVCVCSRQHDHLWVVHDCCMGSITIIIETISMGSYYCSVCMYGVCIHVYISVYIMGRGISPFMTFSH